MDGKINGIFVISVYNCIGRFAVPCFLMLSGVFLLDNSSNKEYKYFYKKSFKRIFMPTILFSMIYLFYYAICNLIGRGSIEIVWLLKNLVKGKPATHLWYMYMLIGVYLLVPLLIKFKEDIGEKNFKIVSWILFPISTIFLWTSTFELKWNLGFSFLYLPYLMTGYSISKTFNNKSLLKSLLFEVLSFISLLIMAYLVNRVTLSGLRIEHLNYSITSNSPLSMLYSIFVFILFSLLTVNINFSKLSNLSFDIYLIHYGVWDFIKKCLNHFAREGFVFELNAIWSIPVFTLIVMLLSLILALVYNKIVSSQLMKNFEDKVTNFIFR
ncbi:MAG: acyltransferase [Clostridia bacterium]|nr:acyltransferase [Clostridia bacterium]